MGLDVYRALKKKYGDERYYITNSYVFDWESDILFKTSSGLYVEIEVKVSKSDFKRDFSKITKHQILKTGRGLVRQGLQYYIEFDDTDTTREWDEVTGRRKKVPNGKRKSVIDSRLDFYLKTESNVTYHEHCCNIFFKGLRKRPNKLYYACPEGLINAKEVPDYSGLLWVSDNEIKIVKKAKQIHKEKVDLNYELLEKFYWRYKNLTSSYEKQSRT